MHLNNPRGRGFSQLFYADLLRKKVLPAKSLKCFIHAGERSGGAQGPQPLQKKGGP